MNRLVPVTAIAIAVAFVAPAAMATWKSGGTFEPDSLYDDESFSWKDAPGSITNRIYFNAYQTTTLIGSGVADPNVAALRTQFTVTGNVFYEAHFGVWTDCNGDGYIGHFESAVREYRSELLLGADGLCPAKTGSSGCWTQPVGSPPACPAWPVSGYNNYNGWVTELIPIARQNGEDLRVIHDPDAAVWGDFGIPVAQGEEFAPGTGGSSCPITPLPRGFWGQTGGAIDYADCFAGHLGGRTYNTVATALNQPALPPLKSSDTWIEQGHPLNQPTFGSGKSSDAMIKAQDCSSQSYIYKNDSQGIYIRPVPANPVNTGGSIAGSYNYTTESVQEDCKPSKNDNGDFYEVLGEGDQAESSAARKTESDLNFIYTRQYRGGALLLGSVAGKATHPSDGGIDALGAASDQSEWRGNVTYVGSSPGLWDGALTRGNLTGTVDNSNPYRVGDARLPNASYATFYAKVSSASTGRGIVTPGATGTYGSPFCSTIGENSGVRYGWECDPALWYKLENGQPMEENKFKFARPGWTYQFRDVDCFDGSFSPDGGTTQAGIEPAYYGEYNCDQPLT